MSSISRPAAHALSMFCAALTAQVTTVDLWLPGARPTCPGARARLLLVVDHVVLRPGVQHALVSRDRHGLGGVDHALDVGRADFAIADRHDAVGVQAADVIARQRRRTPSESGNRPSAALLRWRADRLHGGLDVHHHALLQARDGCVPIPTISIVPSSPTSLYQRHPLWRCRYRDRRSFCRFARLPWVLPLLNSSRQRFCAAVGAAGSRQPTARKPLA